MQVILASHPSYLFHMAKTIFNYHLARVFPDAAHFSQIYLVVVIMGANWHYLNPSLSSDAEGDEDGICKR